MTITDDNVTDQLEDVEERALQQARTQITMADGSVFTVTITNREMVAWDMTAPRKKWGTAKEVPWLAGSFMAWAAARREQLPPGLLRFDGAPGSFLDECLEVKDLEVEVDDVARPTRTGAGPGSS